jgi:NRPS condensation-like uncharacterized protein
MDIIGTMERRPDSDVASIKATGEKDCKVPRHLEWWLDDRDLEIKKTIFLLLAYQIRGKFDFPVFERAWRHVLSRHESLRPTFSKVGDHFRMGTLDATSESLTIEYINCSNSGIDRESLKELFHFHGHEFNESNGPFILIRVVRLSDNLHYLAFKMHHIIYDTLSVQILLRDLSIAYRAFKMNTAPVLPTLKFQYKDYMCFINRSTEDYQLRDRTYWKSKFCDPGADLIIPGQKTSITRGGDKDTLSELNVDFPREVTKTIQALAEKHKTSVFIILQAALKYYISAVTCQRDILVGTFVFGRELDGSEDQIGLYARMHIIRTILNKDDSFDESIEKVKKANEDMRQYTAFPLIEAMLEMYKERNVSDVRWRLVVTYIDFKNAVSSSPASHSNGTEQDDGADLEITNIPIERLGATNIDIHMDFLKYERDLGLKVTYVTEKFDHDTFKSFIDGYINFVPKLNRIDSDAFPYSLR